MARRATGQDDAWRSHSMIDDDDSNGFWLVLGGALLDELFDPIAVLPTR